MAHAPWASIGGDLLRLANWTSAAEQGGVAGHNAVTDGSPITLTGIPSVWSNWYGHRLQFAGFPHCDETLALGNPGPGCIVLYRRDSTLGAVFAIDPGAVVLGLRELIGVPGSWHDAGSCVGMGQAASAPRTA